LKRATVICLMALIWAGESSAATDCPFVRPAGLTASEVDQIVVQGVRRYLERPISAQELGKTFAVLDGTSSSIWPYTGAAHYISEMLGSKISEDFWAAAKAKGGRPEEVLTIAEMQGIARSAYFGGKDSPFPRVSQVRYRFSGILVGSPQPNAGWVLVRCGNETGIMFQKFAPNNSVISTAGVSIVGSLPADSGEPFLQYVRSALTKMRATPASAVVHKALGSSSPCADFSGKVPNSNQEVTLHGRTCYASEGANRSIGYIAMYSHTGSVPADFDKASKAFINSAFQTN
jgi:hypothetical protein